MRTCQLERVKRGERPYSWFFDWNGVTIGTENAYPTPDIRSIGIWIKAPIALPPSRVGAGREKSVGLLFTPLGHRLKAELLCGKDESSVITGEDKLFMGGTANDKG